MQVIPVDTSRLTCLAVGEAVARVTPEGSQRRDREGRPQWAVPVVVQQPDRRADLIEVVVAGEQPKVNVGPVQVVGLEGVQWSMGDRSGVSWRASSVASADGSGRKTAGEGAR